MLRMIALAVNAVVDGDSPVGVANAVQAFLLVYAAPAADGWYVVVDFAAAVEGMDYGDLVAAVGTALRTGVGGCDAGGVGACSDYYGRWPCVPTLPEARYSALPVWVTIA